jgi:guanine nucleotide-binding protein alpha-1 subunit
MQLAYSPRAFAAECASWRAVIQLNLVRSINAILDALASELSSGDSTSPSASPYHFHPSKPQSPAPGDHSDIPHDRRSLLLKLKLRLAPLRQVEADLKARLGAGTNEITESFGQHPDGRESTDADTSLSDPFDDVAGPLDDVSNSPPRRSGIKEVFVRSHREWKEKEKARFTLSLSSTKSAKTPGGRPPSGGPLDGDRDTATGVLAGCADDMIALWKDAFVRVVLKRKRVIRGLWDSAE